MLKRVLSPGRRSKEEQPSSPTAGEPGAALEQQQAGQRVLAAPVDAQVAGSGAAALPPRPPVGVRCGCLPFQFACVCKRSGVCKLECMSRSTIPSIVTP